MKLKMSYTVSLHLYMNRNHILYNSFVLFYLGICLQDMLYIHPLYLLRHLSNMFLQDILYMTLTVFRNILYYIYKLYLLLSLPLLLMKKFRMDTLYNSFRFHNILMHTYMHSSLLLRCLLWLILLRMQLNYRMYFII